MKLKLTLFACLLFSIRAYSQSKNEFSVLYGVSTTSVDIHGAIGDYGYSNKSGTLYGFSYTRNFARSFSLETGLFVENDKVQLFSGLPGPYQGPHDGEAKMISVPVFGKFTFLKYLYVDAGFLFDKQTNYSNAGVLNDQSGLGVEIGVGAKYTFSHITIFVNPYYRGYNITKTDNNLVESGVKFGLGVGF